jgi:ATP-dependent exoDNAse (exonuclease V) beta subunit
LNLPVERFDMVLVDEAQDTNMMQQRLIEMVCPA